MIIVRGGQVAGMKTERETSRPPFPNTLTKKASSTKNIRDYLCNINASHYLTLTFCVRTFAPLLRRTM